MEKDLLRKKYLQKRSLLSVSEIEEKSLAIANKCLGLSVWHFSNFHLFLSITEKNEINTEYLLHILQGKDKNIVIPKVNDQNQTLEHFLLTDNTVIQKNNWGIPEPVDAFPFPIDKIEVVFIPLLAFDLKGNRVGYGKGFYDKFLVQCSQNVKKVGLSFFTPEEKIAMQDTDIPLDFCVTPHAVLTFE
ncbi:MAG: 5-formyltetrahydrofolate cyclo-ligase [Flavobacteriaceae bacterium]